MRYDHFSMLPENAFKPRSGRNSMTLEGGGSSGPQTVTQTSIPEYAQPSMERLIGKAEAATSAPQQIYGGERFAYATPQQTQARFQASQLSKPGQFDVGTGLVGAGGIEALRAGQYAPGTFRGQQVSSERVGYQPIDAAQSGFRPILERFQMEAPERFGREQAQQYMSPYMQEVVDIEKRKAIEDAQRVGTQAGLAAARQGTYGGARQALESSQRERALLQSLGDIQSRGSQLAFEQAQKMFEQDRAAQMAAGRENLAASLGVQELGTRTSLEVAMSNLSADQQAKVQNQASQLQAAGMNQEQALRAALANQGIDLDVQKLGEQSRQFAGELGLRGAGQAVEAGSALARIGQAEQASELERLKAQEAFGTLTQSEQQKLYDLQYADFMAQQQFPYTQMSYMADILRGIPGRNVYESTRGSSLQDIVGGGLTALGVSRELSRI